MNRPHLPLIAFRCYQRPCVVGDPTHGSARSSSSVEHPVQEGVRGGQLLSRQLSVVSLPLALIASARRLRRSSELAAEVASLEADEEDRDEMLAVAGLMESLRAPR